MRCSGWKAGASSASSSSPSSMKALLRRAADRAVAAVVRGLFALVVISSADPGTIPPPIARSNSAIPVASRSGRATSLSSPTSSTARPPVDKSCRAEKTVTTAFS